MKRKLILCMILAICLVLSVATMVAGDDTDITGTVPITISDISVSNIGYYSGAISWNTSVNSTSQVFYDKDAHDDATDYAHQTIESPDLVRAHSTSLTGLISSTTYHYRVKSRIPGTELYSISDDSVFTTLTSGGGSDGSGGVSSPLAGTTNVRGLVSSEGRFTSSVTAMSDDKLCRIDITKDTVALDKNLNPLSKITIVPMTTPPASPTNSSVIGLAYDFGPDGVTFDPPVTITFSYDPGRIPAGINEQNLVLAFYDETTGQWVILSDIVVDPVKHTISGKTSHFTYFGVIAYTQPASFTASALAITPIQVDPGEKINIRATITNTGDIAGSFDVALKINNMVVEIKKLTLAGHSSQTVQFTTSEDNAGNYTVSIDTLSGIFTVKAASTTPALTQPAPTEPATTAPALTTSEPATSGPTPLASTNWGLIGGLIAAAIVISGALVYFLWWRKRPA